MRFGGLPNYNEYTYSIYLLLIRRNSLTIIIDRTNRFHQHANNYRSPYGTGQFIPLRRYFERKQREYRLEYRPWDDNILRF